MTDLLDLAREANIILSGAAFLALVWRMVRAWPAEWAKPDHVGHYRSLLVLGAGSLLGFCLGAFHYETTNAEPTAVSVLVTGVVILALVICWRWPRPRSMRKDHSP